MIRQIEIDEGAARRTAALMGLVVILSLAVPGVVVLRGLEQASLPVAMTHDGPGEIL